MESKLGLNMELVNQARQSAAHVADDTQRFIDQHTTVTVERAVCRLCGLSGCHTGRLCGLLSLCQPGSRLRRTAGLSGRKRSYRRFPTRLSNRSRFANGMASRFDRHASFFYCRLCGAAHSLPGGLTVRPGLHTRTTCLPRHLM